MICGRFWRILARFAQVFPEAGFVEYATEWLPVWRQAGRVWAATLCGCITKGQRRKRVVTPGGEGVRQGSGVSGQWPVVREVRAYLVMVSIVLRLGLITCKTG